MHNDRIIQHICCIMTCDSNCITELLSFNLAWFSKQYLYNHVHSHCLTMASIVVLVGQLYNHVVVMLSLWNYYHHTPKRRTQQWGTATGPLPQKLRYSWLVRFKVLLKLHQENTHVQKLTVHGQRHTMWLASLNTTQERERERDWKLCRNSEFHVLLRSSGNLTVTSLNIIY